MHVSKRAAVAALTAAAFAGSSITAVSALGDRGGDHGNGGQHERANTTARANIAAFDEHGNFGDHRGNTLFDTTLAPTVPGDPALHNNAAGGAPWVLSFGEARLRQDGRLDVRIRGLVIPPPTGNGTPGPVTTVRAALFCGNDTTAGGDDAIGPAVDVGQRTDPRVLDTAGEVPGARVADPAQRLEHGLHHRQRLRRVAPRQEVQRPVTPARAPSAGVAGRASRASASTAAW